MAYIRLSPEARNEILNKHRTKTRVTKGIRKGMIYNPNKLKKEEKRDILRRISLDIMRLCENIGTNRQSVYEWLNGKGSPEMNFVIEREIDRWTEEIMQKRAKLLGTHYTH